MNLTISIVKCKNYQSNKLYSFTVMDGDFLSESYNDDIEIGAILAITLFLENRKQKFVFDPDQVAYKRKE